ncbi:MAG TPA: hypothetical protein VNR91_06465, partial [Sphingomonas sp.]|nr:hypothetical protein [Sphingomonas sp.]
ATAGPVIPTESDAVATPDAPLWPWLLAGLALIAAVGAGFAWGRRSREAALAGRGTPVVPDLPLVPTPPLRPQTPAAPPAAPTTPAATPSPATAPTTPAPVIPPATSHPLSIEFVPASARLGNGTIALDFELVVTNSGTQAADAVRVAVTMVTASPDLARQIPAFNATAPGGPMSDPVTLAPGQGHRIAGQLALPAEAMHVTRVGDRPMTVPVVLVHLRWRGGLSVRSLGDAFLIGTGDARAARLGPIWLDRDRSYAPVTARRFDV